MTGRRCYFVKGNFGIFGSHTEKEHVVYQGLPQDGSRKGKVLIFGVTNPNGTFLRWTIEMIL